MRTTSPKLMNRLICELMHIIRNKNDGGAMVRLTLSYKRALKTFKYVVEQKVTAKIHRNDNRATLSFLNSVPLGSDRTSETVLSIAEEGTRCMFVRFVQKLDVKLASLLLPKLSFPGITDLTIDLPDYTKPITSLLKTWLTLKNLKINIYSYHFLDSVHSGAVSLDNLKKLDLTVNIRQFTNLLSKTSKFPFPADLTLRIDWDRTVMAEVVSLATFPQVKKFHLRCLHDSRPTIETARMFRSAVQCFPSIKAAKIDFYSYYHSMHNDHDRSFMISSRIPLFPSQLTFISMKASTLRSVEFVGYPFPQYEHLESIGFTVVRHACELVVEKQFPTVKLKHRICHGVQDPFGVSEPGNPPPFEDPSDNDGFNAMLNYDPEGEDNYYNYYNNYG